MIIIDKENTKNLACYHCAMLKVCKPTVETDGSASWTCADCRKIWGLKPSSGSPSG